LNNSPVLTIARVVALVSTGLYAGILLGDRAGATYIRPELSPPTFVLFQQILHLHFVRLIPPLILAAILGSLIWLFSIRSRWSGAEFWLVATATAAVILCVVLTRAVNVPINEQLMTWSVAAPPGNLRELWVPWERVHTLRTIAAAGAFLLEALALGIRASAPATRDAVREAF
jgi:uncharacterized membrane protein